MTNTMNSASQFTFGSAELRQRALVGRACECDWRLAIGELAWAADDWRGEGGEGEEEKEKVEKRDDNRSKESERSRAFQLAAQVHYAACSMLHSVCSAMLHTVCSAMLHTVCSIQCAEYTLRALCCAQPVAFCGRRAADCSAESGVRCVPTAAGRPMPAECALCARSSAEGKSLSWRRSLASKTPHSSKANGDRPLAVWGCERAKLGTDTAHWRGAGMSTFGRPPMAKRPTFHLLLLLLLLPACRSLSFGATRELCHLEAHPSSHFASQLGRQTQPRVPLTLRAAKTGEP